MTDVLKTFELSGNRELKIVSDFDVESPREWSNMGTMLCFHKRYNLGDENPYNMNDFDSWMEFKERLEKDHDIAIILPIFMYDHSGITISTSLEYPYNDRWDAGQVGFIFVTKEKIREEYSVKHVTKKTLQKALTYLLGEIEVYDLYLRGEVYGFQLVELSKCSECGESHEETIDSCYGFYGYDIRKNGILDHLSSDIRKEIESKLE
jgi:hypothetical protein